MLNKKTWKWARFENKFCCCGFFVCMFVFGLKVVKLLSIGIIKECTCFKRVAQAQFLMGCLYQNPPLKAQASMWLEMWKSRRVRSDKWLQAEGFLIQTDCGSMQYAQDQHMYKPDRILALIGQSFHEIPPVIKIHTGKGKSVFFSFIQMESCWIYKTHLREGPCQGIAGQHKTNLKEFLSSFCHNFLCLVFFFFLLHWSFDFCFCGVCVCFWFFGYSCLTLFCLVLFLFVFVKKEERA